MSKKTILLLSFIFSPNIGGVESHLDDLCEYLVNHGYDIRVITYQPIILKTNAPSFEKRKNMKIYRIPWIKNLFNRLEPFPLFQMLYLIPGIGIYGFLYLIKHRKEIGIIQAHGFNMAVVGCILGAIFNKPFVVNTHVLFYFNKNTLYAKALSHVLNKAKAVLVLTSQAKKNLEKIGVSKEKVIVYHQWIDTQLFRPTSRKKARERYHLPQDAFVVLFTGRLVTAKGVSTLLNAINKLKASKNIHFVMTGSGEMELSVKNAAKKNSQLHFLGKVAREELPLLYSAANVCIFPSLQATKTYAEGIPRVMIEALSCGTPIIATKTGGVGEVITEKVGFFIKPSEKEIVSILQKLRKQKLLLDRKKEECIMYAKEIFGLEKNARIIEKSLL